MKRWIPSRKRIGLGVLVLVVIVAPIVSFRGLQLWNKHDFCVGKADMFTAWSLRSRRKAADPKLTTVEKRESLIAADVYIVCSRKYATVASRPWLPFPSAPLVTPEEEREILARY